MQINWCLKGISSASGMTDALAQDILDRHGLRSTWLFRNPSLPADQANEQMQAGLSASALDAHVNHFGSVIWQTPYISLSAGCHQFRGKGLKSVHYPAMATALDFATNYGKSSGYIFRMWVVTNLQAVPEIPGMAEEVRDLNLFSGFTHWHEEGEIAAKIVVPRRQILCVVKVDKSCHPQKWPPSGRTVYPNRDYVAPERAANVIGLL